MKSSFFLHVAQRWFVDTDVSGKTRLSRNVGIYHHFYCFCSFTFWRCPGTLSSVLRVHRPCTVLYKPCSNFFSSYGAHCDRSPMRYVSDHWFLLLHIAQFHATQSGIGFSNGGGWGWGLRSGTWPSCITLNHAWRQYLCRVIGYSFTVRWSLF